MSTRSRIVQMAAVMTVIVGMIAAVALAAGGPGYRGPFGLGRVPS